MDLKKLIDLVTSFRNEEHKRKSHRLTHLFAKDAETKLSKLLQHLLPQLQQQTKTVQLADKAFEEDFLTILKTAGSIARNAELKDDIESLVRLKGVMAELNMLGNRGAFSNSEITLKTNDIKSWISRDIEFLQQWHHNKMDF